MIELLDRLGLTRSDSSRWALLRRSRGSLVKRPKSGVVVTAEGRGDWIGWLELRTEAVTEQAIRNTAEVIHRRKPDVLAVVDLAEITRTGQVGLIPDQPFPEALTPRTPAQDRLLEAEEARRDASSELTRRSEQAERANSTAEARLDDLAAAPKWWEQTGFIYKALVFLIALLSAGLGVWSLRPGGSSACPRRSASA